MTNEVKINFRKKYLKEVRKRFKRLIKERNILREKMDRVEELEKNPAVIEYNELMKSLDKDTFKSDDEIIQFAIKEAGMSLDLDDDIYVFGGCFRDYDHDDYGNEYIVEGKFGSEQIPTHARYYNLKCIRTFDQIYKYPAFHKSISYKKIEEFERTHMVITPEGLKTEKEYLKFVEKLRIAYFKKLLTISEKEANNFVKQYIKK